MKIRCMVHRDQVQVRLIREWLFINGVTNIHNDWFLNDWFLFNDGWYIDLKDEDLAIVFKLKFGV